MQTLIGHERKWQALSRAFGRGITPETLLISGPARVGKTTLATRYAQLLLCPNVTTINGIAQPCGDCRICRQVENETFPDFRVTRPGVMSVDKASDRITAPEEMESSLINKAQARDFGAEAMMRPQIGARKVMLIQQADRMEDIAQSVLLKTWEEPISGLTIILLAENPDNLLPTVRSRCWHLRLGLAPSTEIESWLQARASTREISVSSQTLREAISLAAGRPGAAWREIERAHRASQENETAALTRFSQANDLVEKLRRSQSFASLSLSEAAQLLAQKWWDEDSALDAEIAPVAGKSDAKKGANKETRSAIARFLDELSNVYRARWLQSLQVASTREDAQAWARGLDLIRKTRHYILRNANAALALDVMFANLQTLHGSKTKSVARPAAAHRR